jgi:predicted regulator of Ras-like GTPase activity (Roadblock/LC7/MglB family)/CheY-like chemotaxis protein
MNLAPRKKSVLIVDDEKYFLMSLLDGLSQFAGTFTTLSAENGRAATQVLQTSPVDLVVTDLNMPEMDGFALLAHMSKFHPGVPVVVMTAYSTPEIKDRLAEFGSVQVLEKPLEFKDLVATIRAELGTDSDSYLRGITLPAFLQLLEMERKTCTLRVRSKGRVGYLCFREGQLLEADNGQGRGDAAALDIVSWEETEIELSGGCKINDRRIGESLGYILMEGFRLKDERERVSSPAAAGTDAQTEPATAAAVAATPSTHDEEVESMADLKELLTEFTKLQGVNAVCLVGRDGFLLDSIAKTGFDAEMIGAIASSGFGTSESMGKQLGKGAMLMSMIEFDDGPVLFSPVGADAIFVIIADKDANLGMVRMKLKKHTKDLAAAAAV